MTEPLSHRRLNAEELFSTLLAAEQADGFSRNVAMLQIRDHIAAQEERIARLEAALRECDLGSRIIATGTLTEAMQAGIEIGKISRGALAETEAPDVD